MNFSTPDLCDAYPDEVQVVTDLHWFSYGGRASFGGPIETVKCFEDNSRVKESLYKPGHGQVLVVDGGGSLRHALLGDQIAAAAADNGWSGVIIHGGVRDVEVLRGIELGVLALGPVPLKSVRRGEGQLGLPVSFGRVLFKPGHWVYADANGIIVAARRLS
ncbi:MAG: ribonuclease E activity regulator RraA [Wenzhouxiangella sp.]